MAGLKVSTLGPQIAENWGFRPSNFLGGTYACLLLTMYGGPAAAVRQCHLNNTHFYYYYYYYHRVVWQSFAKIGSGTSENRWTEKK